MSVSKIIQQVKAHPEIWQNTHKRYKDKTARELAWKEIAREVGKNDSMIRKRWKNLKDAFRKELKRILVKDIETSSWHYFEELTFISEVILRGIGRKDINILSSTDANEDPAADDSDEPLVKTEIVENEPTTSTDSTTCIDISPDNDSNLHINRNINGIRTHRNKRMALEYDYDADYMFLVSLLPTMRNLSEIQKLQFRGKVNQWLLDAVSSGYRKEYNSKLGAESDDSFE